MDKITRSKLKTRYRIFANTARKSGEIVTLTSHDFIQFCIENDIVNTMLTTLGMSRRFHMIDPELGWSRGNIQLGEPREKKRYKLKQPRKPVVAKKEAKVPAIRTLSIEEWIAELRPNAANQ